MTRVVLVRPWRSSTSGGGGCCSVDAAGVRDEPRPEAHSGHHHGHDRAEDDSLASTYRMLRARLPDIEVQVVTADNPGYLLPTTYRDARERLGPLAAIREAVRSTTAGAVLVDGRLVGQVDELGERGILREVTAAADHPRG